MTKIPLTLVFMTSTKGHFGHKDVYLTALNHFDHQLPLSEIATKVAHIKVSPLEQSIGDTMEAELVRRGFKVLKTVGGWSRGLSHQNEYLADMIKVSLEQAVYENEHLLFLEDDSPIQCNKTSLSALLSRMMEMLKADKDLLTVRTVRRGDERAAPIVSTSIDHFYSEHTNLQPLCMRGRDFHFMLKMIEDNLASLSKTQIEMLWRLVLAPFSRSKLKHAVFWPDYVEALHIGTEDYPKQKAALGL